MKNALLVVAALAGTAWAGPRPDWVDGSSMEYPRETHMVGIGLGDDQASAKERARGEIARVFSSLVTVTTDLQETEAAADKAATFSQSVSQTVQTASKKLLEGVDVVETWQDPATRQHYALAVLERSKAASAVTEKLSGLDKQAAEYKAQLDGAPEKLGRVKAAMKLLTLLKAREELNSELRVLSGGKGQPAPVDAAAVKPAAAKALASLDVRVDITGEGSRAVESGAVQGLNAFGFQAAAGPAKGPADILVEGPVETKPMEGGDKRWKWARSSVTLSLKDGRSDKIFLRVEASERQASADYREAVRRSLAALAKKVAQKVNEGVSDYFENQ